MVLKGFALMVLIFLVALVVFAFLKLGGLPGKIAEKRNHPQTAAVRIMGWIGIFTGGLLWLLALIWAYIDPWQRKISDLEARLRLVEKALNNNIGSE